MQPRKGAVLSGTCVHECLKQVNAPVAPLRAAAMAAPLPQRPGPSGRPLAPRRDRGSSGPRSATAAPAEPGPSPGSEKPPALLRLKRKRPGRRSDPAAAAAAPAPAPAPSPSPARTRRRSGRRPPLSARARPRRAGSPGQRPCGSRDRAPAPGSGPVAPQGRGGHGQGARRHRPQPRGLFGARPGARPRRLPGPAGLGFAQRWVRVWCSPRAGFVCSPEC